ncbi:Uncharacterized protein OBRU01_05136, partial [Operophtera brumata]
MNLNIVRYYDDITSESSSDDDIFAEYVLMRRPKIFRPQIKPLRLLSKFCLHCGSTPQAPCSSALEISLGYRNHLHVMLYTRSPELFAQRGDNAELYRNRKDVFSINTQVVADADLKIRDIVARWPGSVHDSTIFSNSRVKFLMDSQQLGSCCLLGDRGYALKKYLLTPMNREDLPSSDGSAIIENEQENIIFPVTENDQHYRRDLITTYFSSLLNSEG